MEEIPIQGRNWMELATLVRGVTVNEVGNRPGVGRDEQFPLNLDGQQVTQRVASSGFGQPKFSREAIAEFQIVTNMFDITQGRSWGLQVQAITRSGTNQLGGSAYGYFRDDRFNAADLVAGVVLGSQTVDDDGAAHADFDVGRVTVTPGRTSSAVSSTMPSMAWTCARAGTASATHVSDAASRVVRRIIQYLLVLDP